MTTPEGDRPITLRATVDGHVMVEEISGGGINIAAAIVNVTNYQTNPAQDITHQVRDWIARGMGERA